MQKDGLDGGNRVSEEDFKEFIGAAVEELDTGEGMAIALTLEMRKIQVAQPNWRLQDQDFYLLQANFHLNL